jgi:uncharacterized protein
MPASGIKLPDANVWLALAHSDHVHHAKAKEWFDTLTNETAAFCRITQMAFLRHLTNSHIMGTSVQTQVGAWKMYDQFVADPRVTFVFETPNIEARFRAVTQRTSPSHGWWTDAYLSAFAMDSGFQFVTFEKGFRSDGNLDLLILHPGT